MKSIFSAVFGIAIICSCSPEIKEATYFFDSSKITFIAAIEDLETEVVIKKMIRHSIVEDEYTILRQNDTLELDAVGRSFFKVGIRNTILDSVIVDQGDVITISVNNDSLRIVAEKSDIAANILWLNNYYQKVEDSYEHVFEPMKRYPDYIGELRKPLEGFNDYENELLTISHLYIVDRGVYNQNKLKFDKRIKATFDALDSLIKVSDLDMGSKQIMSNSLFHSTVDKFRRMGSTVQDWMYEKMNQDIQNDCKIEFTTSMSDFYLNYQTGKHFQKITYTDLEKAYHKTSAISCPEHIQEIRRLCLFKMFLNGNKLDSTKELFDNYVANQKDSAFYYLIEDRFEFGKTAFNGKAMKSPFIDIYNRAHIFSELIREKAGNVVLVDFWASWCAPCRKGIPDVKKLEQKYENENFKVIYASIDKYPNKWKKASKDDSIWIGNNYWATNFQDSELYQRYNITHIPRYIIYNKSGKVAYQNAPNPDAMEDIIVDMLSM